MLVVDYAVKCHEGLHRTHTFIALLVCVVVLVLPLHFLVEMVRDRKVASLDDNRKEQRFLLVRRVAEQLRVDDAVVRTAVSEVVDQHKTRFITVGFRSEYSYWVRRIVLF